MARATAEFFTNLPPKTQIRIIKRGVEIELQGQLAEIAVGMGDDGFWHVHFRAAWFAYRMSDNDTWQVSRGDMNTEIEWLLDQIQVSEATPSDAYHYSYGPEFRSGAFYPPGHEEYIDSRTTPGLEQFA